MKIFLIFILSSKLWAAPFGEETTCISLSKKSRPEINKIFKKYAFNKTIPYEDSMGVLCKLSNESESCTNLDAYIPKNFKAYKQRLPFNDFSIIICRVESSDHPIEDNTAKATGGVFLFDDPPPFLTKHGLKKNDLVLEIDQKRPNIDKAIPLYEIHKHKGKHTVLIERDGKQFTLEIIVGGK